MSLPRDVRTRPGMFVGDTDQRGVLELVSELIEDSLDHHLAGRSSRLSVEVADDHFCVCDDGPSVNSNALVSAALGRGGRGSRARPTSARVGLGLALVNSLTSRLEIETRRHGAIRRWVFEDFALVAKGERIGDCEDTGTCVRAWPDPAIFSDTRPDTWALESRLADLHQLRPSLSVELDGRPFATPAGLAAWVRAQPGWSGEPVHTMEGERGRAQVEAAWALLPPFGSSRQLGYVNLYETVKGGSHIDGVLKALAEHHDLPLGLVRERAMAIVSVVAATPRLDGLALDEPGLGDWICRLTREALAAAEP